VTNEVEMAQHLVGSSCLLASPDHALFCI
jgi:hypothetical protein